MPRLRSFHLDRSSMGTQRLLFIAMYAVISAGISSSVFFIFSSLRHDRAVDPDPLLQLVSPLSSSADRFRFSIPGAWTRDIFDPPPLQEGMPPLEAFKLTKDLVASRAKDNVIVMTYGNHAFMDMIINWVRHLVAKDVLNILVGAMDTKLLEALYWKGVPVFDMGTNTAGLDLEWGSREFHKRGRDVVNLLITILPFGFEVLLCDSDTVWLKNPLPYLAQFPEADILVSSDTTDLTSTDDYLDKWKEVTEDFNIGIFHWRPTEPALKFAKEWYKSLLEDDILWDQGIFNKILDINFDSSIGEDESLVFAYNHSIKLGLLPVNIFCSGHTYFIQRRPQQLHLEAYVVHTTFQFGASAGKRHRLREAMLFYDPEEYFNSPGGFLTFKPRIPRRLLVEGPHTVESHFSLVNYQLKQIRTALAISSLLNRTLVMPPLWCRLDRLWFNHSGSLENSLTTQPFLCPMDHVLLPSAMLADFPERLFGPRIEFREYSFLENPSLPKEIKESQLHVQPCKEQSSNCNVAAPGLLRFPMNSNEDMFVEVFSSYKDIKVLEFSFMDSIFKGFSDKQREKRFRRRVSRYTDLWCCLQKSSMGHIYYDMFWDEKPGWKPLPPETSADDRPMWVSD